MGFMVLRLKMDFSFIPEKPQTAITVPYFEDATKDYAPYYSSTKSQAVAKSEIREEFAKLGAEIVSFQPGFFQIDGKKRPGFLIRFAYLEKDGLIRVAGLPIRNETPRKLEAARLQALLNVRDWAKALVTQAIFTAGASPLLSHLLVSENVTISDYILSTGRLLPAGEVVEGVYHAR